MAVDELVPVEPLHDGSVGARQSLRPLDDRRSDGVRVELEGGDLLLRLDDRVQLVEARAQSFFVAPTL